MNDSSFLLDNYRRFPVKLVGGRGSILFGSDGREYIDLAAGVGVNVFGVCDEGWIDAVTRQLCRIQHTSNSFYSLPAEDLARELCTRTGMKKAFFSNSGAEANEAALKAARKYSSEKKGKEYTNIITVNMSFHGRTIATLSASGQDVMHDGFYPLTPGFVYCDDDPEMLCRLAEEHKTAAIMIETIRGEGGVVPLSAEFIRTAADIAKKEDILLIVDEVQTGNGRCGALYSYMNFGIEPDIVTTAKGLGGGLPIGATLFGGKTEKTLGYGTHGSTFGGNPVACAGALYVLSRLNDELFSEVREKSKYVFSSLSGAKGITDVSGAGLMIGIKTEKSADEVLASCREKGVLAIKAKDKIRLLPALNIPLDLLQKGIEMIKEACG